MPIVFEGETNLMRRIPQVSPGLLCACKDIGDVDLAHQKN